MGYGSQNQLQGIGIVLKNCQKHATPYRFLHRYSNRLLIDSKYDCSADVLSTNNLPDCSAGMEA